MVAFGSFDLKTVLPATNTSALYVKMYNEKYALKYKEIKDFYFIMIPAHATVEAIKALNTTFTPESVGVVSYHGYAMNVIHYVRNP